MSEEEIEDFLCPHLDNILATMEDIDCYIAGALGEDEISKDDAMKIRNFMNSKIRENLGLEEDEE